MLKRSITLLAVLMFTSLAFAQSNASRSGATRQSPGDTCAFTFSTGTGRGLTQYCVSANGNIVQFSAMSSNGLPVEFLDGVNPATEGYGICDTTTPPAQAYWDFASSDSGNWNPSTVVNTPTSVKVTRTTADGIWRLVQTITEIPGSKFFYGKARIITSITNLSSQSRFLALDRYANIDAGSSTFNDFDKTEASVWGQVLEGNGPGLSSTAAFVTTPFDFSISFVNTVPDAPIPCQIHNTFISGFFEGDGGIDQDFNLEIGPGKTKTVGLTYSPI